MNSYHKSTPFSVWKCILTTSIGKYKNEMTTHLATKAAHTTRESREDGCTDGEAAQG